MKVNNFKVYDIINLRLIRDDLVKGNIDSLPTEIMKYIRKENTMIGSRSTRIFRCIHLIDEEVINRFINKEFE